MFSEEYRKVNDEIHMRQEASDVALAALRKAPAHSPWIRRTVAIAACAAVAIAAVTLALRLAKKPAVTAPPVGQTETIAALSYDEAFSLLSGLQTPHGAAYGTPALLAKTDESADGAAETQSITNRQYENVDEADFVKYDGTYFYILNRKTPAVSVVSASGADTAEAARIDLPATEENGYITYQNIYCNDSRLAVLYTESRRAQNAVGRVSAYTNTTHALIYDVSDPTHPKKMADLGQDGHLQDSRVCDGVLYLASYCPLYFDVADRKDPATFVPAVFCDGVSHAVAEQALCTVGDPQTADYAVITSVDLAGAAHIAERAVIGAGGGILYANDTHLILATVANGGDQPQVPSMAGVYDLTYDYTARTRLSLFGLSAGKILPVADTVIEGTLDGQFAVDEYEGTFRLAVAREHTVTHYRVTCALTGAQTWETVGAIEEARDNAITVLDTSLNTVTTLGDIAEDETVRSVRFLGAVGYVVTFRQTDPLFAVDFSDPAAPKLLSALKLTGFSEYLHPYAENRLLGFGYAGDETGITNKLRISMFDTADPTAVTLLNAIDVDAPYSTALWDHHALLTDTARGVIGLPVRSTDGSSFGYRLYRYAEQTGFSEAAYIPCGTDWQADEDIRGVFADEWLYLCRGDGISVLSPETFSLAASLSW